LEREIKGFIIGALVSGGIHLAIFFSPLSPAPILQVKETPGSIEISLGAPRQTPEKEVSMPAMETTPIRQKIETTRGKTALQAEDRVKTTTEVEDDTSVESKPDRRGDSVLATPQQAGNPKPPYPEIARRRGYEGTVRLKVEVLASGEVGRIWIKESSGYEVLDRSALKTVKHWGFIPARFSGIPVKSTVIIPVTFQLKE
jgi:protein TonB